MSDEQDKWEAAYSRFETPEQEVKKFISRFKKLGQHEWGRDLEIVDLFCGRGNGLIALEKMGFTKLEGVDFSQNLLDKYSGPAKLYCSDCRDLPFEDNSKDMIVIQGGLHHMIRIPEDIEMVIKEITRVLKPEGKFLMVEPWNTPFLKLIHYLSARAYIRKCSDKFDAFEQMYIHEQKTYDNWRSRAEVVDALLHSYFRFSIKHIAWGKFLGLAYPRSKPLEPLKEDDRIDEVA